MRAFFMNKTVPIIHGWLLLVLICCVVPVNAGGGVGFVHIDKVVHILMYAIPAYLLLRYHRLTLGWLVYLALFGVMVEYIQSAIPYRNGDSYDILANWCGVGLGLLMAWVVNRWCKTIT